VPLLIALLSWHRLELQPSWGLDNSWHAALLRIAIAAAVFAGARRSCGTAGGALIALVVAGAIAINFKEDLPTTGLETVPFLVFSAWVVDRVSDRRQLLALMAVGGAVARVELLHSD
jgi:hypothetical protein